MSADNVMKFLEKVSSDAVFRNRLEMAAESEEDPQAEVRKIVAEAGFSFTPREYRETTDALRQSNLSDKELGNVVGGLSSLLSVGTAVNTMLYRSSYHKTLA